MTSNIPGDGDPRAGAVARVETALGQEQRRNTFELMKAGYLLQEDHPMSSSRQKQSYVELFDISKKAPVAKAPSPESLTCRSGERISFRSINRAIGTLTQSWLSNISLVAKQPASGGPHEASGMDRVTLYVERSIRVALSRSNCRVPFRRRRMNGKAGHAVILRRGQK